MSQVLVQALDCIEAKTGVRPAVDSVEVTVTGDVWKGLAESADTGQPELTGEDPALSGE